MDPVTIGLIASAVVGAGSAAYSVDQQRDAALKGERAQTAAMEQQDQMLRDQKAAEADAKKNAPQDLRQAARLAARRPQMADLASLGSTFLTGGAGAVLNPGSVGKTILGG